MKSGFGAGRLRGASLRPSLSALVRLVLLAAVDFGLGVFAQSLLDNGATLVAWFVVAIAVIVTVIFLSRRLYPLRWIAPGLALLLLFVIYPVVNTVHTAFTNAGGGHLLTKEVALSQLAERTYTPEGDSAYAWTAYRADDGTFILHLTRGGHAVFARSSGAHADLPAAAPAKPPPSFDGYARLTKIGSVRYLTELQNGGFREVNGRLVAITSLDEASEQRQRYAYDSATDSVKDAQTGVVYKAKDGTFTSAIGVPLSPGYTASVGTRNFSRILSDPNVRGPFLGVFVWTFVFAGLSVLTCFALGFVAALILNDTKLPGRGFFRALVLTPYALPIFIGASIWVGLLNPIYGPVNGLLDFFFGISPSWFTDANLAKGALILIGLWLGFPYMMLITLGALQSIPKDVYDAADIDGAGRLGSFRYVTLPLVLASVSPILVGAFAFAFNNFTLIELVTKGGPANVSTNTPAGHTDILLSYTYRLAFTGGEGIDYGLAASVTMVIFLIVAAISLINFRLTRRFRAIYDLA